MGGAADEPGRELALNGQDLRRGKRSEVFGHAASRSIAVDHKRDTGHQRPSGEVLGQLNPHSRSRDQPGASEQLLDLTPNMRDVSLWRALLGVEKTVIERVEFDEDAELLVAHVRPTARARSRCGVCGRRRPGYDPGEGRRRWRSMDLGTMRAVLEADAPRVRCPQHGVVVASVPWARHDAGHTYAFDETVAWLTTQSCKSTVTGLMRIAWRTVGSIITRVWEDVDVRCDRLAGLRRIGIDEISYKKGHRYLMVVVDHDTRALVWAAPGRSSATVREFFDLLGPERCGQITHVSADGADFIDSMS